MNIRTSTSGLGLCGVLLLGLAATASAQTITTSKQTPYTVSEPIVLNFTGAGGAPRDYLGLFMANAPDPAPTWPGQILAWVYTNGTQTPGQSGITQGSVTFTLSLPTGNYEARFFPNDALVSTARTAFVVKADVPTLPVVSPTSVLHWPQVAPDLAAAAAYAYAVIPDGGTPFPFAATCTGTTSPFDCGGRFPFAAFTTGSHNLAVTAANAFGVSTPSPLLLFEVPKLDPAAPGQPVVR